MCLDFDSSEPLHVQFKQVLKSKILDGHYKQKIPSERELMKEHSVSRTTVRLAVSMLVNEGIFKKTTAKEHLLQILLYKIGWEHLEVLQKPSKKQA